MGKRCLLFGNLSGFANSPSTERGNSNTRQREEYQKFLYRAIKQGLTKRQQQVIMLYYFEHKNMVEISQLLSVNKSTVSRTMRRAIERLRQLAKLYFELQR